MGLIKKNKPSTRKASKLAKDKFYQRAKVAGFRARSAYKLIQLDRRYNFLSKAKVCIDLCAAPGSWMQVATKFMPGNSVVIGVDLYPIRPIPQTISIVGDITTDKVREEIKKNIRAYQVDVVLHDGSPKVGSNWFIDAYNQNILVLHAFKLACEFLRRGGTFITKVFRSKDHTSLEFVFKKLFKKVEGTKPSSSRFESAEFYIVCQGFLRPDDMDPRFFDAKHVFLNNLDAEPQVKINLLKPEKVKAKAVGYEEGVTMLFKKFMISKFLEGDDHIGMLQMANEFEWDLPDVMSDHKATEIKELIKDIKVLGRKELRHLLTWRKANKPIWKQYKTDQALLDGKYLTDEQEKSLQDANMKLSELKAQIVAIKKMAKKKKYLSKDFDIGLESGESDKEKDEIDEEKTEKPTALDEEFDELEKAYKEISILKVKLANEAKKQLKKVSKRKAKLLEKMKFRMLVTGDAGPQELGHDDLFSLSNINNVKNLDCLANDIECQFLADPDGTPVEEVLPKTVMVSKRESYLDSTASYYKTAKDSDTEEEDDDKESVEDFFSKSRKDEQKDLMKDELPADTFNLDAKIPADQNPLITDLVGDAFQERQERTAEAWFAKSVFDDLEKDAVEDYELDTAMKRIMGKESDPTQSNKKDAVEDDELDTDKKRTIGSESDLAQSSKKAKIDAQVNDNFDSDEDGFRNYDDNDSDSSAEEKIPKAVKKEQLDNIGLALATKLIHSKKAKRDLRNKAWNRYMYGDEVLPSWFAEDEKMFNSPMIEVDKDDLKMYAERNKAVNVTSIKKVVEAKARKLRRHKKRMNRYRKRAEAIGGTLDITEREKASEMKKLFDKATSKKKETKYVVMTKRMGGMKSKGQKGKMVDSRLKKDKRATLAHNKKQKKKAKYR